MNYYVYVYTDPISGAVRYVGSGSGKRIREHTQPSQIDRPSNNSPFYRWLRENRDVDWNQHRKYVLETEDQEEAIKHEQHLIEENLETVLNVRAAGNGREMKPALRPPREPYGIRTASGWAQARRKIRKNKFGGDVHAGRGISKDGNGWRVRARIDDKLVRKQFTTYCAALQFRKSLE